MKTRIISATILLILLVPAIVFGGLVFNVVAYILSILALNEFLKIKEEKKKLPMLVKINSYLMYSLIIFSINLNIRTFVIDERLLISIFISYLIFLIYYNDEKKYSANDALYLIGGILFLGFSFSTIIYLRNAGIEYLLYVVLISTITDAYAYFGGYFIGKHKLISISPKKTWEGSIIGTIFCTFVGSLFYYNFISPNLMIIVITFFLSIIGQFGDLVFSAIKRYYKKKDFSNLIPGHGGILDRLDSIIFVVLGYMLIVTII